MHQTQPLLYTFAELSARARSRAVSDLLAAVRTDEAFWESALAERFDVLLHREGFDTVLSQVSYRIHLCHGPGDYALVTATVDGPGLCRFVKRFEPLCPAPPPGANLVVTYRPGPPWRQANVPIIHVLGPGGAEVMTGLSPLAERLADEVARLNGLLMASGRRLLTGLDEPEGCAARLAALGRRFTRRGRLHAEPHPPGPGNGREGDLTRRHGHGLCSPSHAPGTPRGVSWTRNPTRKTP